VLVHARANPVPRICAHRVASASQRALATREGWFRTGGDSRRAELESQLGPRGAIDWYIPFCGFCFVSCSFPLRGEEFGSSVQTWVRLVLADVFGEVGTQGFLRVFRELNSFLDPRC